MTEQDKKSILLNIFNLKINLLKLKLKKTTGDQIGRNDIKNIKKEIARSLTKLNKLK